MTRRRIIIETPTPSPPSDFNKVIRRDGEVIVKVDDLLDDASDIPEAVPLNNSPLSSTSEGEDVMPQFPKGVTVAFYPVRCSSQGLASEMANRGPGEPSTSVATEREKGPGIYFLDDAFIKGLEKDIVSWNTRYHLGPGYTFTIPGPGRCVMNPHDGTVAVYKHHLDLGLRFPLHPFIPEILNAYNLSLYNLMPNSVAIMIAFIAMCNLLGIQCSLNLWRNVMKISAVSDKSYGKGWWSFQARSQWYRVLGDYPSHNKEFRSRFVFVHHGEGWPFARWIDGNEANTDLNYGVEHLNREEALVALAFLKSGVTIEGEGLDPLLPCRLGQDELKNEYFLSYAGLSWAHDRVIARNKIDGEMADKLKAINLYKQKMRAKIMAALQQT